MGLSIHTIALGVDNTYLIRDQGIVLIDAGQSSRRDIFLKGIKTVYPAHGKPFAANAMRAALSESL